MVVAEADEDFFYEDNVSLSLEVDLKRKSKKDTKPSEVECSELNLNCVSQILANIELKL